MSNKITLELPFPVSVNAAYAGRARRYKSPAVKRWIKAADAVLLARQAKIDGVKGPYHLAIDLNRAKRRTRGGRRDCWNYEKVLSDWLVSRGIVRDDSDCDGGKIGWANLPHDVGCRVSIIPIKGGCHARIVD